VADIDMLNSVSALESQIANLMSITQLRSEQMARIEMVLQTVSQSVGRRSVGGAGNIESYSRNSSPISISGARPSSRPSHNPSPNNNERILMMDVPPAAQISGPAAAVKASGGDLDSGSNHRKESESRGRESVGLGNSETQKSSVLGPAVPVAGPAL
jgi:hypothetical protein